MNKVQHIQFWPLAYHIPNRSAVNRRHSPFLKLPAEVRTRIYEHVLGGKVIHARRPGEFGGGPVKCAHPVPSPSQSCPGEGQASQESERTHETPGHKARLSLNLLLVCRQIYHEAVLTPFTHNKFIDAHAVNGPCLCVFLDRIVPAQVRLIKHLTVNITHKYRHYANDLNRLQGLQGLETLELNLLVRHSTGALAKDFITPLEFDLGIVGLDSLRLPKLTCVRVNVPQWQRRASMIQQKMQHVKTLRRVKMSPRQALKASKWLRQATFRLQEHQKVLEWVKTVEIRILSAARPSPRASDAVTAA